MFGNKIANEIRIQGETVYQIKFTPIFIFILLIPSFSSLFSLFKHLIHLQLFIWLGIEHTAITWYST